LTRYDRGTVAVCIVEVFGGKKRSLLLAEMVEEMCSANIEIYSESDITDSTDHSHICCHSTDSLLESYDDSGKYEYEYRVRKCHTPDEYDYVPMPHI
jgi:hypothetical protein